VQHGDDLQISFLLLLSYQEKQLFALSRLFSVENSYTLEENLNADAP